MINNLIFIVEIIGLAIVAFIAYSLLKKYVFSKIKVSKWIIIAAAVIVFVLPLVLKQANVIKLGFIFSSIQSGVMVILLLWLMDTMGWGPKPMPAKGNVKSSKSKYATTTVIKAKAKPNRLKNSDMEVIDIKDLKKNKKK